MRLPSTLFSLNIRDFLKGAVVAVIVPVLYAFQQALQNPPIIWKEIGTLTLVTFIGYLTKNFFTNDVPAAEATIATAQAKVIEKQL